MKRTKVNTLLVFLRVLHGENNVFDYDANGNRLNLTEKKDTAEHNKKGHPVRQAKLALDQRVKFSYTVRRSEPL